MSRIVVIAVVAAAVLATTARAGGAPVALLIPAPKICADGSAAIRVGVRTTNNPPGPRRYAVQVRGPTGRLILARAGTAPLVWRRWRHDPSTRATGIYRTTYRLAWATHVFQTRVARCRR